jgi:hypothetical protein
MSTRWKLAPASFALVALAVGCTFFSPEDFTPNKYNLVSAILKGIFSHTHSSYDAVPRAKATAAASTYTLSSSTPFLPFTGNRLVVADPFSADGTTTASAILQRQSDCTLTESIFQQANSQYDITSVVNLPNAQDYLHQLSGLTTQADLFPRGCVDKLAGKAAVYTALPISTSGNVLRFADLNPSSEQLEARSIDRTTGAQTITALTSGGVQGFTVVDMNNDGLNDIVAYGVGYSSGNAGNLVVFLNNGDGTFRTAFTTPSPGAIVVDDVDGDGKLDVVMSNGYDSTGTPISGVTTMLGNGDGTLRAGMASASGVTRLSGPFITGDFNGDGKLDVLFGTQVLFGLGNGTFAAGPSLPSSVVNEVGFNGAVGDVNNDGKLDLVYTTTFGTVQVMLGNGDGTFVIGARYASIYPVQQVAISEIDGDGNLDIVVGNASQGIFVPDVDDPLVQRMQVLLGRGDGTFVGAPAYPGTYTGNNASAPEIATGDFDGDGKFDVLVVDTSRSNTIEVLPGDGLGGFRSPIVSAVNLRGSMIAAVDMNGDGKPDAIVAGQSGVDASPVLAVLTNQGNGLFAAEHDYALPNYPVSLAVGDFDGDGLTDVVVGVSSSVTNSGVSGVYVLFGQANGTLAAPVLVDATAAPLSLAAADVNGDGRADLAIANGGSSSTSGALHLYLGNANRTFTAATAPTTSATTYSIVAFADIDGDGKPDLVAGGSVPGTSFGAIVPNLYTFFGNGDGTFGSAQTEALLGNDGSPNAIAIADFNHDGHPDVAIGNSNDFTEMLVGVGDGTWRHGSLALGQLPGAMAAVDLDNDHYPELLVDTAAAGTIVFKNAGTVAAWVYPTATTTPTSPTTPVTPATGDFTVTATPASGSIMAGQSAQTIVAVAPTGGFSGTVTLACSAGLPTGATCSFSPNAVTLSGTTAGSSALTIATHAATALGSIGPGSGGWPQGMVVTLFGSTAWWLRRRRPRWAGGIFLLTIAGVLASCGGDDGSAPVAPAATATTYPITITAASASTTHTVTYQLTVH